jgi:heme exporter protein C
VNIPIIKYSVEWWNTLHQGATFTLTEAPKMSASMWMPLLLMMIGSYLFVATLAIYRTNTLILNRDQGKAWVKEYLRTQKKQVAK